jgi:hypothetical protein
VQLTVRLPRIRLGQIKARLAGRSSYPLSLLFLEMAGNLAGPWGLWRSRRRVAREGRSVPYVPVPQRRRRHPDASPSRPPALAGVRVGPGARAAS